MTDYFLDPYLGSDANTGLSWAQALKTFRPFQAGGSHALVAGDRVKIAKSPDPALVANTFTFLTGSNARSHGRGNFILSTSGAWNNATAQLTRSDATTNWTFTSSTGALLNSDGGTFGFGPYSYMTITPSSAGLSVGTRVALYVTSPIDLTPFSRLEIRHSSTMMDQTAGEVTSRCTYDIQLYSDTAATNLLQTIPFDPMGAKSEVWSWEGALTTTAVRAVAIVIASTGTSRQRLAITELIATRPLTHANYLGYWSQLQTGDQQAATWSSLIFQGFSTLVAGALCGKAAEYNTSRPWSVTVAAGWAGLDPDAPALSSSFSATLWTGSINNTDRGLRPLFDLRGLEGTVGSRIVIEGGYDPGTDTVTGRTHLHGCSGAWGRYGVSPILVGGTAFVTIRNVNLVQVNWGMMAALGDTDDLVFEDCYLHVQKVTPGTTAAENGNRTLLANDTDFTLTGLRFVRCTGTLLLYRNTTATTTAGGSWGRQYLGVVEYEDCVVAPYTYMHHTTDVRCNENIIKIVGDMHVYIPTIAQRTALPYLDDSAPLYVYGSGIWLNYYAPQGTHNQPYSYPTLALENAPLYLGSTPEISGTLPIGRPSQQLMPSLSMHFTINWASSGRSAPATLISALSPYAESPPLDINNWAVTGTPYLSGNANAVNRLLTATEGQISIRNFTGPTSGWLYALLGAASTSDETRGGVLILRDITLGDITVPGGGSPVSVCQQNRCLSVVKNVQANYLTQNNTLYTALTSALILVDSDIRNANGTPMVTSLPTWGGTDSSFIRHGLSEGLLYIHGGGAPAPTSLSVATYEYTTYDEAVVAFAPNSGLPTMHMSGSRVQPDLTVFHGSPQSWKSTLLRTARTPYSVRYPLGSLPVKLGHQVTITLWVRRSHATDSQIGLMVVPNGANGPSADALQELVAWCTEPADTWQQLSITFIVQISELIDVYVSHYGSSAAIAWYDDFEVYEA